MDTFVMIAMLVIVLIYHFEQKRYFREINSQTGNLDKSFKKKNEPVYRNLRAVDRNERFQSQCELN
jgi:hypothetical protein